MAAAPTPAHFSVIFGDRTHWRNHDPDYATMVNTLGGAAATDSPAAMRAAVQLAAHSPVVFAMSLEGSEDYIYVGHSPATFPMDLTETTPYDNHTVMLTGNRIDSAVAIVLQDNALGRLGSDSRTYNLAGLTGPNGHNHPTAPVFRHGPHASSGADTIANRLRRVMVMPPSMSVRALTTSTTGRYTLLQFYNAFIAPEQADATRADAVRPLTHWYLGACTNDNHGNPVVRTGTVLSGDPVETARLNHFVSNLRATANTKLGLGGPLLTAASFQAGVAAIQNTMTQNTNNVLTMEREKKNMTVTKKLGDGLSEILHLYCNVTDDASLPEAHGLMAKSDKGRAYAIINNLLMQRTTASPVYLSAQSPPIATPKLVDELFRNIRPANAGTEFGVGNTPFAMVCGHHAQANKVYDLIQSASFVEGGASLSLEDAQRITTYDDRFPSSPSQASDQLCAWSVVSDIFHGVNHDMAVSIRNFVMAIAPQFQTVFDLAGAGPGGMDILGRIMFEAQQDYYHWCHKTASGEAVSVPDFSQILDKANSNRASSLSQMPIHWYHLMSGHTKQPGSSAQVKGPAVATFNANADSSLLKRFQDSGHATISALLAAGGEDVKTPKHGGKEVCLTWALKGKCSATCKRKNMHIDYGNATNKKIHELLDQCGVASHRP